MALPADYVVPFASPWVTFRRASEPWTLGTPTHRPCRLSYQRALCAGPAELVLNWVFAWVQLSAQLSMAVLASDTHSSPGQGQRTCEQSNRFAYPWHVLSWSTASTAQPAQASACALPQHLPRSSGARSMLRSRPPHAPPHAQGTSTKPHSTPMHVIYSPGQERVPRTSFSYLPSTLYPARLEPLLEPQNYAFTELCINVEFPNATSQSGRPGVKGGPRGLAGDDESDTETFVGALSKDARWAAYAVVQLEDRNSPEDQEVVA